MTGISWKMLPTKWWKSVVRTKTERCACPEITASFWRPRKSTCMRSKSGNRPWKTACTQKSPGSREGQKHAPRNRRRASTMRSEEHTSELQSHSDLVCRLLLEKKKKKKT